jgi:hypothetical protein
LQELLKVSNPDDDAYIQALEAVKKLNEVYDKCNEGDILERCHASVARNRAKVKLDISIRMNTGR